MYPARFTQFISHIKEEVEKTAIEKVREIVEKLNSFEELSLPDGVAVWSYLEPDRISELKEVLGGKIYIDYSKDGYILVQSTGAGLLDLKFKLIREILGEDYIAIRRIRLSRDKIVVEIAIEYDTIYLDHFDETRKIAEKIASAFGMKLSLFYLKGGKLKDLCFVGHK